MQRGLGTLGCLCLALWSGAVAAQTPPVSPSAGGARPVVPPLRAGVPASLVDMKSSLARIAAALERQAARQDVDLALKAIDLRMRRLADIETQLQGQRERRHELEAQRIDIESKIGRFVRRNQEKDLGLSPSEVDAAADDMRAQVKELREQVSEIDQQIAGLENEVASRRVEVDQALQLVDRRIEQRQ